MNCIKQASNCANVPIMHLPWKNILVNNMGFEIMYDWIF